MRPPTAFSSAFIGDLAAVEVVESSERYAMKGELGRGGMGVVYLAHDRLLGRDVAFKRPRSDLPEQVRDQVLREAALTASLPHPGIVPILDAGEDDEGFFYTMPVLTGTSLRELAPASSVERVVQVLVQVCNAMGYAHARGVVHRDLKPANLLVGEHGAVRVLDWGVALDPKAPTHGAVGTEGYASPEQAAGKPVDATADVYALGRTLAVCVRDPPEELHSIIGRATRDAPSERYADGSALGADLEAWLRGTRVQAHEYRVGQLLGRWLWRRWVPVSIAGVGLLAVAVTAGAGAWSRLAEFQRAEEALATSLALRAADERSRGLRYEAERLAAQALRHIETPVARGVLMQWDGEYAVQMRAEWEPPCEGRLRPHAYLCRLDDTVEAWRGPERVAQAVIPEGTADAELEDVDWHPETGFVYFWSSGRIVSDVADVEIFGAIPMGPFLHRQPYDLGIFKNDQPAAAIASCPDRFETAAGAPDGRTVVACGDGGVWTSGEGGVVRSAIEVDVAALEIAGSEFFIGTHDSRFARAPMAGAEAVEWHVSEGGAPMQFVVAEDWVAVRSERGVVHVYRRDSLALVERIPGDHVGMALMDGVLHLSSGRGTQSAWVVGPPRPPRAFDFAGDGGVSALHVDASGERLLVGHATGRVHLVDVATGTRTLLEDRTSHVVKNALFVGDDLYVQSADHGRRIHPDGSSTPTPSGWWNAARAAFADEAWFWSGEHTYSLGEDTVDWPSTMLVAGPDGVYRYHEGVVSPVRQRDGVSVGEAQSVAVTESAIFTVSGETLRRFDREGVPSWTVALPFSRSIRVAASRSWVAVGSLNGGVAVFEPETGATIAVVPNAHSRRVAGVQIVGERLFTSSWDGYVRVWSLDNARRSAEEVMANLPTASPRLR